MINPRTAAAPTRRVSPTAAARAIGDAVLDGRRTSRAKATTTAASSMASPVTSKTTARPNTATTPPSAGPKIRPAVAAPDSQPYAIPRPPSGTTSATRARAPGRTAAAPTPWIKRNPISQPIHTDPAQAALSHRRGHRLDGAEGFRGRLADVQPASRHGGEDSRPGHVVKAGTDAGKRLADDAKALAGLLVDVGATHRRPVRSRRRTTADFDGRPNPHSARVSHDGLPLATGGHDLARHAPHATSPRLQVRRQWRRAPGVRSRPGRRSTAPSIAPRPA